MNRKYRAAGDNSTKVPAYIVTFSDMTTLLLTFFVMLLSLAQVQDEELFGKGRESFLRSIRGLGLGMLSGRKHRPDFGYSKIRYFISGPDKLFDGRTIDAKEEDIRRIFQKVGRSATAISSRIVAEETIFSVTNIRFSPGDATLSESSKRFLTEFCLNLRQDSGPEAVRVYVLGLAGDEPTERDQWILSAKRAWAVADFLQAALSSESGGQTQYGESVGQSRWAVYSWGAGPGGDWVVQDSPVSRQSQILIGVLRANERRMVLRR